MKLTWIVLLMQGIFSRILLVFGIFTVDTIEYLQAINIAFSMVICSMDILCMKNKMNLNLIIMLAFMLRLFLLFWDLNFSHVFTLIGSGMDTNTFRDAASSYYYGGSAGIGAMYSMTVAVLIYGLFGVQPILAVYVNILLSISTIIITKNILTKLKVANGITDVTIFIMAIMPFYAMINVLFLRETIIQFFIAASLYYFILWFDNFKHSNLFFACAFSMIAASYHSGAIALLCAYAFTYIFYNRKSNMFIFSKTSIFAMFICVILYIVIDMIFGEVILARFGNIDSFSDITLDADLGLGSSAYYASWFPGSGPLAFIMNTPTRILYYMAAPVPWIWRGVSDVLSFVCGAVFYLYSLYLGITTIKFSDDNEKRCLIVLLVIVFFSALIFGWGVSNSGTAIRHRDKFVSIHIVLLALGLNIKCKIKSKNSKQKGKCVL
ncbi:MAG: hypothetical protein R3Y65_03540 [Bacillota bacterium]